MADATSGKVKVLVVEDDAMILDMYVHKFEQEGFAVSHLDRGDTVVAVAERERPALILLDVIMPGLDGFTVLQGLKENPKTKAIPVVMLTNLGQDEDKTKGQQLGAVGYVVKSNLTPGEVVKKAREFLQQPSS
jgi:DNA-binding response OmpR family regulator